MKYDVIIVGAGVSGAMIARELSRLQLSVCILEKENDVAMHATHANSGIVHGGYDPVPGTLKAKMNSEGVEPLFEVAKELNVPCIRNGSMVCAFGEEENKHLEMLLDRGRQNGTPGLKLLTGDEARAIDAVFRQATGEPAQTAFSPVCIELSTPFPLTERFAAPAAAYLAAMLVIDENEALSDTLYSRYCDLMSDICAACPASSKTIIDVYGFN